VGIERDEMKNRVILFAIFVVGFLLISLPTYAFDSELLPGEGGLTIRATADSLVLYVKPFKTSPVVKEYKTKKKNVIDFDLSRYRNIKPGKVKVQKDVKIEGRSFGNIKYLSHKNYYSDKIPTKIILFNKGETIDYLQDRSEGSCIISRKGQIIELDYCPWFDSENKDFINISSPVNEAWIRVIQNKKPVGWLLLDKSIIE